MAGKLDEISEAIGRLRASVADSKLQDRRHADNSAALRDLGQKLDKHAAAVDVIRPTVAALALSRSRLATWASIGLASVAVLGWIIEGAVKWAVSYLLSHTH
jgi:hypothetical protein